VVSVIAIFFLARWARARRESDRSDFPVSLGARAFCWSFPGWPVMVAGFTVGLGCTGIDRFQTFETVWVMIPELIRPDAGADHAIPHKPFIAEIVRSVFSR